jgi:Ca-activated chloride channel family protein
MENNMKPGYKAVVLACVMLTGSMVQAAGLLQTVGSSAQSLRLVDHDVNVLINNGFARVEVTQRFSNSGGERLEAVYRFPLPRGASLSEMRILSGENVITGEVMGKEQAREAYSSEKQQGRDAGLATQESGHELEFRVTPIAPHQEVTVSFVYYQPVVIDTGIGRFVYPLQEGGTDDGTPGFWNFNDRVENSFSINLRLKSAWPVESMRAPGLESVARVDHADPYHWTLKSEQKGGSLNRDFVLYYRLADNLPGRVEVIPYRKSATSDGTFMMVVTPGADLQPLKSGSDFVFVLDVSGSMQSKLATLLKGISQSLGRMSGQDRFRVVTFNDQSREVVPWTAATPENVQQALSTLGGLTASGGTNLYAGLERGLQSLDASRTTSLILVTDGVTNTGIVDPKSFAELVKQVDLRLFGFVMGNNANWPLVSLIAEASGGFYAGVSNDDDIVGQILLARSKLTSEAMHNVQLELSGGGVHDVTTGVAKIYRGQQVVLFGRYSQPGKTRMTLKSKVGGQDKTYTTEFELPTVDGRNPEIERLWALASVDDTERRMQAGLTSENEGKAAIRRLGVENQIVTRETSMVVMQEDAFQSRGIDRRNARRVAEEQKAQAAASSPLQGSLPPPAYRVDSKQPAFGMHAPSLGGGHGGAAGPWGLLGLALLGALRWVRRQPRR